jgi:hypothetical protein
VSDSRERYREEAFATISHVYLTLLVGMYVEKYERLEMGTTLHISWNKAFGDRL